MLALRIHFRYKYSDGWQRWKTWAQSKLGVPVLPAVPLQLVLYLTELVERAVLQGLNFCLRDRICFIQYQIAKCCIIYKRLQGHVPAYLKSLLKLSRETHSRQTRYANFNVACPIAKRQKEGGRAFTVTTC